jgi:hypothetical protein
LALLQKHDRILDVLVFEVQNSQVSKNSSNLFTFLPENLHCLLELHKQTKTLALKKVYFFANLLNHVEKFEALRTSLASNHAECVIGSEIIFDGLFVVFSLCPIEA